MPPRSPEIPVREWWLLAARGLLEEDRAAGRNLVQLGKDLAKHIDRVKPFSHSMLSRFKAGEIGVTLDLHEALIREFVHLPCGLIIAETREEALDLMHTQSRYRSGNVHRSATPAPVIPFEKAKKPPTRSHVKPHTARAHSRK